MGFLTLELGQDMLPALPAEKRICMKELTYWQTVQAMIGAPVLISYVLLLQHLGYLRCIGGEYFRKIIVYTVLTLCIGTLK